MLKPITRSERRRVAFPKVLNVSDLRQIAERRIPRVVFDYLDGGADAEVTLESACRVYDTVLFRPRGAVAFPDCDLRVRVLGMDLELPFLLGPVGSSRLFHPGGEVAAAHAAGEAGTTYIQSTLSGHRLEDSKAATRGPMCYQLYLLGGRAAAEKSIERCRNAGIHALFVTIDTPVSGLRERDFRNKIKQLLARNVSSIVPFLSQFVTHPRWLLSYFADGGLMQFPNVVLPSGPMEYADVSVALEQTVVTWKDLSWIRELWGGPIVIKGVMTSDDALRAIDAGAEGIVVSNHGARQLDCVLPTLRVLPEIARAANGQIEVLLDGGIRRGSDVVKALCLGAKAVLLGRAYAYGLAAAGEAGVVRAIEILRGDVIRTLKLLGVGSLAELNRSHVELPWEWERDAHASQGRPLLDHLKS
ncbi:MAG: alpha-hydroxy-acid oxidizing protein [Acidobacteriota bacterium]|nr:alpha-hydroxy-acid oxidizing protein [Acidobacteriota bacterium]